MDVGCFFDQSWAENVCPFESRLHQAGNGNRISSGNQYELYILKRRSVEILQAFLSAVIEAN
jgi:hypothetical protein